MNERKEKQKWRWRKRRKKKRKKRGERWILLLKFRVHFRV